jgi:membrane-bound lytic murein transglycosylase B
MAQSWPRPPESLNGDEKIELQRLLKKQGYYDGEIDGNLGKGSRAAIAEFQRKAGVNPDGAPSKSILLLLRK